MKRIVSLFLALLLFTSTFALSASAADEISSPDSADTEIEHITDIFYSYHEEVYLSGYFLEKDDILVIKITQIDDVTVFFAANGIVSLPWNIYRVIGDYVFANGNEYLPYALGIFALKDDTVYTIEEAYNQGVVTDFQTLSEMMYLHPEKIYIGGAYLIGDATRDFKIDINDATAIQKYIAGYKNAMGIGDSEYETRTIIDYNRDNHVNVKDVTDIQKTVAGITE